MLTYNQLKRFEFKMSNDTTVESRPHSLNLLGWLRVLPDRLDRHKVEKLTEPQKANIKSEIVNFINDLEKANEISAAIYIGDPTKIRALMDLADRVAEYMKELGRQYPDYAL